MKKILAVDDEPSVLLTLSRALQHEGYSVTVTSAPTEVEALVGHSQFDLVVLDVHMPEKNGIDLFVELKEKNPSMRVLSVTAYQESFSLRTDKMLAIWKQHFSDGETDILYKPFKLDALYGKVEGLIGSPRE